MKNLDWGKLSFGYSKTDYNVRCYYKDGKWSAPEVSDSEMLNIHMASTCLHYGQEAFEGMKAFRGKDGKIRQKVAASPEKMDELKKQLEEAAK